MSNVFIIFIDLNSDVIPYGIIHIQIGIIIIIDSMKFYVIIAIACVHIINLEFLEKIL